MEEGKTVRNRLKLERPEGYKEIIDELKREMKAQMHTDETDFQGILKIKEDQS